MNKTTETAPVLGRAAAFFEHLARVLADLASVSADPLAPARHRDVAALVARQIHSTPILASLLGTDWESLRGAYGRLANCLKLAEGLVRRARHQQFVPEIRAAYSDLWTLAWAWNVQVHGVTPETAHHRLSLLDPRFRNSSRSIHAA